MKISIITVCYNSVETIEDTLKSIASQTYPHIEHIVIDGGSTDGALAVLERYRAQIAVLISEPDRGIYDAMNKGLARATGEVIGFLNADDYYAGPEVIATIARAFQREKGIEGVYGDLLYIDPKKSNRVVRYWQSNPFKPGAFLKGWCPAHPTFYVRKSVYDRYGVFDLNYKMGNDVELMMRFMECQGISTHYLPEVLVHMRVGGASNQSWKSIVLQNKEIIRAAKVHQLPIRVWAFILHKLWSRLKQVLYATF